MNRHAALEYAHHRTEEEKRPMDSAKERLEAAIRFISDTVVEGVISGL